MRMPRFQLRTLMILVVICVFVLSAVAPILAQERKAGSPAPVQPPRATPKAAAATPGGAATRPRTPDFKIVFWVNSKGLNHQVYDVRKGQYTKAVDDWVNDQPVDASGFASSHLAVVRDVYLDEEKGQTEREKLVTSIARGERQILGIGRESGRRAATLPVRLFPLNDRPNDGYSRRQPDRSRPILPGSFSGLPSPLSPASPFPYPYPRPHP